MQKTKDNAQNWYAIRVTYNREMKVKASLDDAGVESFIPMCYKDVVVRARRVRKLVPSVHNLIFIKMSDSEMKQFKATTSLPIRYIMDPHTKKPIIVPERQMDNFISVSATNDDGLIYLSPDQINISRGDRVRIIGGMFSGCEGTLMRIRGDRRLVVSIPGVMAVATTFIHPSLIMKIDENDGNE